MNNIVETTKKFIMVLNDNSWSIDRNVGAIAKYFHAFKTNHTYSGLHEKAADCVEWVAGRKICELAGKVESSVKNIATSATAFPSVMFEEFGLRYYGPIDGHDLPVLIKTFEHLKEEDCPVILHIVTEKEHGNEPAKANPMKFHGLGPYKTETGETPASSTPTYSQVFARAITDFAKEDKTITAITGAMPSGTGLTTFKEELPDRYYDVGIAEEHTALFASGQATMGLKPFLAIYSTFMQWAYDMFIHDVGIQNLPVRIVMDRAGLSRDDGPTHHGLFDIGYLRHVPNFIFMQPRNEDEFVDMLWTMANHDDGPSAVRYPRGEGTGAKPKAKPELLEIGKAEVVKDGTDVALFGFGTMFGMAEEAKDQLETMGYLVALINPRWIKPLDAKVIEEYASKCSVICTFEDHVLHTGFGAAIIEHLNDADILVKVERIGWPDEFVEHGGVPVLREKHDLMAGDAVKKVQRHLLKPMAAVEVA